MIQVLRKDERQANAITFIVVPQEVGTTAATVWVGAAREGDVRDRPARLELGGVTDPVELTGYGWRVWQTFKDEDPVGYADVDGVLYEAIGRRERPIAESFYYQRVELGNPITRTSHEARFIVDGHSPVGAEGYLRSCSFRTLPTGLPRAESGEHTRAGPSGRMNVAENADRLISLAFGYSDVSA